jgi:hypothetical protein
MGRGTSRKLARILEHTDTAAYGNPVATTKGTIKMKTPTQQFARMSAASTAAAALALLIGLGAPAGVNADEQDARKAVKAMSDYLAGQTAISFAYDADLEVVTKDQQKLSLASSGTITLNRPDKIRVARAGGFADVELVFDGKTLTLLGKTRNMYTQLNIPGTLDHLVDELKNKYDRPLPAADLLLSNAYDQLMPEVTDVKDLGSGVIGGVECDYFAFRQKEVDWQIWIAQGAHPYPCRYAITSKLISGGPQYTVTFRDWKAGNQAAADDFRFRAPKNATKVDLKDLADDKDLPSNFLMGAAK